jgi:hypothetical protein
MVTKRIGWSLLLLGLFFYLPGFIVETWGQELPHPETTEENSAKATEVDSPRECSPATLKGAYGFQEHGTIMGSPPFPDATSGIAIYDGEGNFHGTYTDALGGPGTFEGTYTVNSECIYSDEFTPGPGPVYHHHAGPITGDGIRQEVHYIYTDAGGVVWGTLKKIPPKRCSLATLKGTYAQFSEGTITVPIPPPPPFPVAFSGILTFDGAGKFSGQSTGSLGGVTVSNTVTGTYAVDPDCTLSVVAKTAQGVTHEAGTITGEGQFQEIRNITTDAGLVLIDTAKKQMSR